MQFNAPLVHFWAVNFLKDLPSVDSFLDCVTRDEPEDNNWFRLPDAICPVDGLVILARVPVGIKDNHICRRCQGQSNRSDSGCQEKN